MTTRPTTTGQRTCAGTRVSAKWRRPLAPRSQLGVVIRSLLNLAIIIGLAVIKASVKINNTRREGDREREREESCILLSGVFYENMAPKVASHYLIRGPRKNTTDGPVLAEDAGGTLGEGRGCCKRKKRQKNEIWIVGGGGYRKVRSVCGRIRMSAEECTSIRGV